METEIRNKKRQVHLAVRNVLINELGISKEMIQQIIAERVDKLLKQILEETNMKKLVLSATDTAVKGKVPNFWRSKELPFDEWVKQEVRKEIQRRIKIAGTVSVTVE